MSAPIRLLVVSAFSGQGGIGRWLSLALPQLATEMSIRCVVKYGAAEMRAVFDSTAPGVMVEQAPLQSPLHFFGFWFLRRALMVHRPQVVLVQDPFSMVGLALLRMMGLASGVRYLVVVHSAAIDFPHIPRWKQRLVFGLAGLVLRHQDRVFAVSEHVAAFLQTSSLGRLPIAVIPNGFKPPVTAVRAATGRDGPLKVGYVGRFSIEKGADRLVPLMHSLTDCPIEWHVAGAGKLEVEVTEGLRPFVAAGRAVFHGWLADPVSLIRELDILLIISRTEGCPFSVLEAHACGTLVVSLAVGGMPEILDEGRAGILLSGIEDLEAKLREISLQRPAIELLVKRARSLLAEKYSWDRMIAAYKQQIYEIAGVNS